ncbi:MAG: T9SS type A sorting domain-containing protein [Bacteroidales bacterium]|nr:T9SS type A sorting domain-containing protein [Bacteroidales bacterium]
MKKVIVTITLLAIALFTIGQIENSSNQIPEQEFSLEKAFLLNDTIWVLDSTLQQQWVDNEFVNQRKTIILLHDEQGKNISRQTTIWNGTEGKWANSTYDSTLFYPSGGIAERFNYDWNTNGDNWKMTFYNKLSENNLLIERTQLRWDNDKNKYLHGFKQWTEFDETGLPQNAYWNDFDSTSQEFVADGRTTYFYDENDLNSFTLREKWDELNQSWNPNNNAEMFYNADGMLVQRTYQEWDTEAGSWQNTWKNIIRYNTDGLVDTNEFYAWLPLYSMWYPSYRLIRTYDDQDMLVESIRQEDGYGDEEWMNESRILQYFENGKLAERRTQTWDSGNWMDDRIELMTYVNDTLFESQTYINYDPYNEVYDTVRRYLTIFNDRLLPIKFLIQDYSNESAEFVTNIQWLYYFSPLLPNDINETEPLEFTVYPNPSSGIFRVNLPEQTAKDAMLTVSGLSGNIIFQGFVDAEKTSIDLSGHANGIYFVRLVSANKTGVKKLVKF